MPDLSEQLRTIVDHTAEPVDIDDVRGRVPGRGIRQSMRLAAAAVVAIAVLTVAIVTARSDGPNVRVTTPPSGAPAGWTRLPDSPLGSRAGHVMVWTGHELLVWGGANASGVRDDGASFDPAARQWTRLPDSPLHPTSAQLLDVWTGTELLVWDNDGSDSSHRAGAAYNPATRTWRTIAPSPVPPNQYQPIIVWAGTRALVWSATNATANSEPVRTFFASYDPQSDRWQTLDSGPLDVNGADAAWDGHELLVTGWLTNHPNGVFPVGGEHPAAAYDPAAGTWRTIAFPDRSMQQPFTATWDGHELLAITYNLDWSAYDPSTNAWSPVASVPLQPGECGPDATADSTTVFLYYCGHGAIYDTHTRTWTAVATPFVPHGPSTPSTQFPPNTPLVALDSSYVIYGAGGAAANSDAWSYTPTNSPVPPTTATTPASLPAGGGEPSAPKSSVYFVDSSHGWISGSGGLFATSNGGSSWQQIYTSSSGTGVGPMYFSDTSHGWAVDGGALMATTDGGHGWQPIGDAHALDGATQLHFSDSDHGWAVVKKQCTDPRSCAQAHSLLETTDSGLTWHFVGPASAMCWSGQQVWTGTGTTFFMSRDAGGHWDSVAIPRGDGGDITSIACSGSSVWVSANYGVAAGSAGYDVMQSTDDGAHWALVLGGVNHGSNVQRIDAYNGPTFAVSSDVAAFVGSCPNCNTNGTPPAMSTVSVTVTTDGGKTFEHHPVTADNDPGSSPIEVTFADTLHGWILVNLVNPAGPGGGLYSTSDGGRTWTLQFTDAGLARPEPK